MKTDRGPLVTMRPWNKIGLLLQPGEWLHQTEAAANSCLETAMAFEALWQGFRLGHPIDELTKKLEQVSQRHAALCKALNDSPLIGQEVQELEWTAWLLIPEQAAHRIRNDAAHRIRDDAARHSGMMPPTIPE